MQDARKALSHENYAQAMLLAGQANIAADNAVTWLLIPIVAVFAGVVVSTVVMLRKRAKRPKA